MLLLTKHLTTIISIFPQFCGVDDIISILQIRSRAYRGFATVKDHPTIRWQKWDVNAVILMHNSLHNSLFLFCSFTPLNWDFPLTSPLSCLPRCKWKTASPSNLLISHLAWDHSINSNRSHFFAAEEKSCAPIFIFPSLHSSRMVSQENGYPE